MFRRKSALRADAGTQLEEMVKREWGACLRRIQKDSATNDDSSVAVYHMTSMISDVLGSIRTTVPTDGSGGAESVSSGHVRSQAPQDRYDELIAEVRAQ